MGEMQMMVRGDLLEGDYFSKSRFWEQDSPETLTNSCLSFIVNNFNDVFFMDGMSRKLSPDIFLPPFLFEELHKKSLQMCRPLPQTLLVKCLTESQRFPIRKLDLGEYNSLREDQLKDILSHRLVHLNVDSEYFSPSFLKTICDLSPSLVTLKVGKHCQNLNLEHCKPLRLEKLRHLSLNDPSLCVSDFFESHFFNFSNQLTVLDLSDCKLTFELQADLARFRNLESLSLHNVITGDVCSVLEFLTNLKKLRKLDLGRSNNAEPVIYRGDLSSSLKKLVDSLQNLGWLEICGTNLAANTIDTRSFSERMSHARKNEDEKSQPVEWMENRHLEYLGLLNCSGHPCTLEGLPANKVSGDNDVEQILTSLETYIDRPPLLLLTLNTLFDWIRSEDHFTETQEARALESTLRALDRHRKSRDIQLSGSASIFYMMKGNLKSRLTVRIKRHVIRATLDAMERTLVNPDESSMCRNGCLILCHLRIPQDLIHDYSRVVSLLLRLIEKPEPRDGEPFIQRVSLNLLNSLACQVDNAEKLMVGELGTFEVMLNLIRKKLDSNICDEIMEVAWSLMWNATDETAPNCERFIGNGGLTMFMKCYEAFKNKGELLRNMMGLMGNVAEVDHLKSHLMNFIPIFKDLLDSESDGIEVSYNSCGILANIILDGSLCSKFDHHWSSVRAKMRQAMARWPITSERNINYRSFGPILRLLDCGAIIEVQLWALWALSNLTKVYRSKYCPLLKEENGVDKLIEIFLNTRSSLVKRMAVKVIRRCNRFESHPDEVSDAEDYDMVEEYHKYDEGLSDRDEENSFDGCGLSKDVEIKSCHEDDHCGRECEESYTDANDIYSNDDDDDEPNGKISARGISQRRAS